jgi:hypothetical protein
MAETWVHHEPILYMISGCDHHWLLAAVVTRNSGDTQELRICPVENLHSRHRTSRFHSMKPAVIQSTEF